MISVHMLDFRLSPFALSVLVEVFLCFFLISLFNYVRTYMAVLVACCCDPVTKMVGDICELRKHPITL